MPDVTEHGQRSASPVSELTIRNALASEYPHVATMNRKLIEDEKHRNPMTVAELEQRFHAFVDEDGWTVDVFILDDEIVGYATHRREPDEAEAGGWRLHLRQFYIAPQGRGRGIGRRAVELLFENRFEDGERVFLGVLETNPGGRAFWRRVGFVPYSTTMEQVVVRRAPRP